MPAGVGRVSPVWALSLREKRALAASTAPELRVTVLPSSW